MSESRTHIVASVPNAYLQALLRQAPAHWQVHAALGLDELQHACREFQPDGIIVYAHQDDIRDAVSRLGVPAVNVSCALGDPGFPRSAPDNGAAARMAVDHLLQRGYQHIGILSHTDRWYADQRRSAAQRQVQQHGCSYSHFTMLPDGPIDLAAAKAWQASLPKRHALMAINDTVASRWMTLPIYQDNPSVIVGIDDVEFLCDSLTPTLSSVRWSLAVLMAEACDQLQGILVGESVPAEIMVPPTGVIIRQSTEAWASEDPLVSAALHWIQEHYPNALRIDDIATKVGCHRRRLERCFRAEFGRGPRWFIEYYRMEAAKNLLETTSHDLRHIADTCGFKTLPWFSERFKVVTGVTPGAWRRAHQ